MPANNSVIPIRAFRQGDQQNGNVNAIGELQTGEKIGIQHINTGTLATNTAFQSALANTNAYIASVAASGGEVANAYLTSTFTTNTVFQSALANTNAYIASSAGSASFPFFVGGSSVSTIPISDGVFPFFNSAGNADNIGATGDIVTDTTPQLGGNLDVVTHSIVSTSNRNINITPNGTGKVVLDGISYPTADGNANQVLTTNGSGAISFADASGGGATGGGSDAIFYENGQTITTSYTITTNTNAMSAGPLTVNSGVSVTVPSGSRWVVL